MNIQQYFEEKERKEQEKAEQQTAEPDKTTSPTVTQSAQKEGTTVIPVVEESVHVHKEVVESARVRVHTNVYEVEKSLSVPLTTESHEVKRVPMNEFVDERPPIRQEGNCLIIPVVEEVLVVQKRLKLVEEVHVIKRQMTTTHKEKVTVKKEDVTIERIPTNSHPNNTG